MFSKSQDWSCTNHNSAHSPGCFDRLAEPYARISQGPGRHRLPRAELSEAQVGFFPSCPSFKAVAVGQRRPQPPGSPRPGASSSLPPLRHRTGARPAAPADEPQGTAVYQEPQITSFQHWNGGKAAGGAGRGKAGEVTPAADPTPSPFPRCPRAVKTSRLGEASAASQLRDGRAAPLASPPQAGPEEQPAPGTAPPGGGRGGCSCPVPVGRRRHFPSSSRLLGARRVSYLRRPTTSSFLPPPPRACKPGRELPTERSSSHAPRTGTGSAAPGGTPRPAASPAGGRRVVPGTCAPQRSSISDGKNLFHQRSALQSAAQDRGGRRAGSRSWHRPRGRKGRGPAACPPEAPTDAEAINFCAQDTMDMCFTDNAFVRVDARNRFPTTPSAVLRADPARAGPRRPAPYTEAHGAIKDSDNDGKAYVLDRCVYMKIIKIKSIRSWGPQQADVHHCLPSHVSSEKEASEPHFMHGQVTPWLVGHLLNAPGQTTATLTFTPSTPTVGIKSPERRVVWLQRLASSFPSGTVNVTMNTALKFPLSSSLPLFVSPGKSLSKGIYSRCISGSKLQHTPHTPPSRGPVLATRGSGHSGPGPPRLPCPEAGVALYARARRAGRWWGTSQTLIASPRNKICMN